RPVTEDDLRIGADGERVRVRAIGVATGTVTTEHVVFEAPVVGGEVPASPELDLAKLASIERHGGPGPIGLGLVTGLGRRAGAGRWLGGIPARRLTTRGLVDGVQFELVPPLV